MSIVTKILCYDIRKTVYTGTDTAAVIAVIQFSLHSRAAVRVSSSNTAKQSSQKHCQLPCRTAWHKRPSLRKLMTWKLLLRPPFLPETGLSTLPTPIKPYGTANFPRGCTVQEQKLCTQLVALLLGLSHWYYYAGYGPLILQITSSSLHVLQSLHLILWYLYMQVLSIFSCALLIVPAHWFLFVSRSAVYRCQVVNIFPSCFQFLHLTFY